MTIDIVIDKETEATLRVRYTEGTPATWEEKGAPEEIELIEAWYGSDGREALRAINAFGIDLLAHYEDVIMKAVDDTEQETAEEIAKNNYDTHIQERPAGRIHKD